MGGVAATLFTDWLLAEDYYRSLSTERTIPRNTSKNVRRGLRDLEAPNQRNPDS